MMPALSSHPSKIAHLVVSFQTGGAERMALALAARQKRAGHKVELWSVTQTGPCEAMARAEGLKVRCFEQSKGFQLSVIRRMAAAVKELDIQVLHSHNPMPHFYATGVKLISKNLTLVHTRHNMGTDSASSKQIFLFRQAMRVTKAAVSVCRAAEKNLLSVGAISQNKARVIPNGIDLSQYRRATAVGRKQFWDSLGRAVPELALGSIGRLTKVKNHKVMLEALGLALPALPKNTQLVLAGAGGERQAIEALVLSLGLENNVTLLGERSDVPFVLGGIDLFLQSSLTEGYSLALVEAAATGIPCLVSAVGGNSEIVQEEVTGLLVPSGDVKAFSAAMVKLGCDKVLMNRLGSQAFEWAQKYGSLDEMYQSYESLYFE
jgi:glycosyltransferase involved in cell wall biosynthesis